MNPEQNSSAFITEAVRQTELRYQADLIVVGASCTGVSAAVRAARLGKKVVLIEATGRCGGVAVNSLVNVWHSLFDEKHQLKIISGLSEEIVERLKKRQAVIDQGPTPHWQFCFNSNELACELDELITEHPNITLLLHSRVVTAIAEQRKVQALVVENKSGRFAIQAQVVIDASGDADVLRRLGVGVRRHPVLQPPTAAAILSGVNHMNVGKELSGEGGPLQSGFIWTAPVPGTQTARAIFGTRVHHVDCSNADDLTKAEIEGRRQVRAMVDHLRAQHGHDKDIAILALPTVIGIRETVHAECLYTLTEEDVLEGRHFDDAIAFGSYRVDVHTQNGDGVLFKYLDGRQIFSGIKQPSVNGRWREERDIDPTYYSVPYRSIVVRDLDNVLVAGRCIDTDSGAHAAVRVMINCNQLGEAAGVAASIMLDQKCISSAVPLADLQVALLAGGSQLVQRQPVPDLVSLSESLSD